ncbi:transglycosylase family protein [Kitasatospora sp. NPDC002227]|uniref:transglycosylase family protein n=1 Tax=Kitasatospora sp. NPDC002227 TaxID=3154773 RepID=UPI003333A6BC
MGEERIFMLPINATKRARRLIAATGVVGLGLTIPCLTAGAASAASVSTWDKVAQCESSGDWSINTGNGFYGGLQFTSSTWAAYGGHDYAAQANQATKDQQISVAEKVLADQGPGAWPVCSIQGGLTRGGAAPQVDTSAKSSAPAKSESSDAAAPTADSGSKWGHRGEHNWGQQAAAPAAGTGTYTVAEGDWLSTIAQKNNVQGGWEKLYDLNKSVLTEGPDMIYPGQHLSLGTAVATPQQAPAQAAPQQQAAPKATTRTTSAKRSGAPAKAAEAQAPAATGSMAAAIAFAESKLGQAYVYGGTSDGGWDCSGLTQAAFRQAGISLPRVAADQADATHRVSLDNLQPGDLLFWSNNGSNSGVYHVALYVGDGKYVEAANPRAGVKTETVANWAPDFAGRI